jgi:DNA-binding IclR family transcriptional regulator
MPINPSPAVLRACEVLDVLSRHPTEPLSLAEITRRVGVPRATCDAVLLALAAGGYVVRREEDLRYVLGSRGITLGTAARLANTTLRAASVEAEQLARRTSACVAVTTRDGDETRVTEVFDFGPPFSVRAHAGQSIPLRPPFGAVFVAWETSDGIAHWLDSPELADGDEVSRYRSALAEVRRRGYSVTVATDRRPDLAVALETLAERPDADEARRVRDELMRQMMHSEYLPAGLDDTRTPLRVTQMSAPVFDRSGRVAVAIMLLGPSYEVTSEEIATMGDDLVKAAQRATTAAGGHPSDPGDS